MRKSIFIVIALTLLGGHTVLAQDDAEQPVDMGNYLTASAGMVYEVLDNPFTRFSVGYDFSLNDTFMLSAKLGFINSQNLGREFAEGVASAGLSQYLFAGPKLKALFGGFFVSHGYDYQRLIDGTYEDPDGVYQSLTRSEVPDELGVNVGLGYHAEVSTNLLLIPELSLNYNLPTEEGVSFEVSDLGIGIDVGVGINPSAWE
ncbi:MAG: hypothetical protein ACLFM0_04685 [Spirochaetales bacterium]